MRFIIQYFRTFISGQDFHTLTGVFAIVFLDIYRNSSVRFNVLENSIVADDEEIVYLTEKIFSDYFWLVQDGNLTKH